jgi:hypothetical protein
MGEHERYTVRLTARQEGLEYRTDREVHRFDVLLTGRQWQLHLPGSRGEGFTPYELTAAEEAEILPRLVRHLERDRLFGIPIRSYTVRVCRSPAPRSRGAADLSPEQPVKRTSLAAATFLFAGALFLFIGLRSEPRQTAWLVMGIVMLVLGLARLARGRAP